MRSASGVDVGHDAARLPGCASSVDFSGSTTSPETLTFAQLRDLDQAAVDRDELAGQARAQESLRRSGCRHAGEALRSRHRSAECAAATLAPPNSAIRCFSAASRAMRSFATFFTKARASAKSLTDVWIVISPVVAAGRCDPAAGHRSNLGAHALEVEIGVVGKQQRHLDRACRSETGSAARRSRRSSAAPVLSRRVRVRSADRPSMPGMAAFRASRVTG